MGTDRGTRVKQIQLPEYSYTGLTLGILTMLSSLFFTVILCGMATASIHPADQIIDCYPGGHLTSPGYPHSYGNSLDFIWLLTAPRGMHVHIHIDVFDLEPESHCIYDNFTVRDDAGASQTMCGTDGRDMDFVSVGSSLSINLVSDYNTATIGFSLTYEITGCDVHCFEEYPNKHISYGTPVDGVMTSVCDCASICLSDHNCIGFDFNNEDAPFQGASCWIHTTHGDLIDPFMDVTHFSHSCH